MKFQLSIILCLLILTSCFKDERNRDLSDSLQRKLNEKKLLERSAFVEYNHERDSIRLLQSLQEALVRADNNITKDSFRFEYEAVLDSAIVKVVIDRNNHFSKDYAHLIVRRYSPGTNCIDIYRKSDTGFERVLSHEEWNLTYVSDTIRDINGDGLRDFVVNGYGSSGCCLKGYSIVYLIRPDQSFSKDFEFINPSFSPTEHVIRGICYGHPGETEMYKYTWRGENIDTVEYVYYEKDEKDVKTGKVIVSYKRFDGKVIKRLNDVPKEYKTIYGYDWFTGDIE